MVDTVVFQKMFFMEHKFRICTAKKNKNKTKTLTQPHTLESKRDSHSTTHCLIKKTCRKRKSTISAPTNVIQQCIPKYCNNSDRQNRMRKISHNNKLFKTCHKMKRGHNVYGQPSFHLLKF